MNWLAEFRDVHKGETILVVGNGANLAKTPLDKLRYPSIGMNTIVEHEEWSPDYYVTVDRRVRNEFGDKIDKVFSSIPKFLPFPRFRTWSSPNTYFFRVAAGPLWPTSGMELWQADLESSPLTYGNCMHVAIKIAYWMGAKTILLAGMEHKPGKANRHFWGVDKKMDPSQPIAGWLHGYSTLVKELAKHKVKLVNISEDTFVPAEVIPQDNWENWKRSKRWQKQNDH